MDIIEVPPRRIVGEETVDGEYQGGIIVESGAHLRLTGSHQGSLRVASGAVAEIVGAHQGSLRVAAGAHVQIHGRQQGSVHVAPGGLVEVAANGRCQGSLHVEGRLVNGGVRGGRVFGHGAIEDVEGGRVKPPDEILPDGSHVYRWTD